LSLFTGQAFPYNAIFFTDALVLTDFYGVPGDRVGPYILPFAAGSFLGPLLLGPWFDTFGRKPMISGTYIFSRGAAVESTWVIGRLETGRSGGRHPGARRGAPEEPEAESAAPSRRRQPATGIPGRSGKRLGRSTQRANTVATPSHAAGSSVAPPASPASPDAWGEPGISGSSRCWRRRRAKARKALAAIQEQPAEMEPRRKPGDRQEPRGLGRYSFRAWAVSVSTS
jgi:hypothetical protein